MTYEKKQKDYTFIFTITIFALIILNLVTLALNFLDFHFGWILSITIFICIAYVIVISMVFAKIKNMIHSATKSIKSIEHTIVPKNLSLIDNARKEVYNLPLKLQKRIPNLDYFHESEFIGNIVYKIYQLEQQMILSNYSNFLTLQTLFSNLSQNQKDRVGNSAILEEINNIRIIIEKIDSLKNLNSDDFASSIIETKELIKSLPLESQKKLENYTVLLDMLISLEVCENTTANPIAELGSPLLEPIFDSLPDNLNNAITNVIANIDYRKIKKQKDNIEKLKYALEYCLEKKIQKSKDTSKRNAFGELSNYFRTEYFAYIQDRKYFCFLCQMGDCFKDDHNLQAAIDWYKKAEEIFIKNDLKEFANYGAAMYETLAEFEEDHDAKFLYYLSSFMCNTKNSAIIEKLKKLDEENSDIYEKHRKQNKLYNFADILLLYDNCLHIAGGTIETVVNAVNNIAGIGEASERIVNSISNIANNISNIRNMHSNAVLTAQRIDNDNIDNLCGIQPDN